jgi:hypothetical protein
MRFIILTTALIVCMVRKPSFGKNELSIIAVNYDLRNINRTMRLEYLDIINKLFYCNYRPSYNEIDLSF